MRKIINHHIEGGTRESHPRVQDLQHPRLGKPRRGLQIFDTRMGFPRPSLNVVLDSINHHPNFKYCTLFVSGTELRTVRRMIQLLDAPGGTFRPGA